MGELRIDIKSALTKFLMSAITSARTILNYEFTNTNLQEFYEIVDNINDHLTLLELTTKYAFLYLDIYIYIYRTGLVFAVIVTIGAFIVLIFDFKLQVIILRGGKEKSDILYKEGGVEDAGDFPGNFIANCCISFIFTVGLITLIGTVLGHKLFWYMLWEYRMAILLFILPKLIAIIQKMLLQNIIYDREADAIKMRK